LCQSIKKSLTIIENLDYITTNYPKEEMKKTVLCGVYSSAVSTCLPGMRPWVSSPAPGKKERKGFHLQIQGKKKEGMKE
jgi:hypothetical protein